MQRIVRVLALLFLLTAVALAAFLFPQHVQTRRIEPPLPSLAELRAAVETAFGPASVGFLNTSEQRGGDFSLGHSVFLLEWPDGRSFMIDAGMDRAAAAEFAELMELLMRGGEVRIHGDIAELLGERIARVAGVGFTHLHVDHTQGVLPFCAARGPGAKRYQTRWQAREHNFNTREGAGWLAGSCLEPGELGPEPIQQVKGFPGLALVALGGHTPGSTLFAAVVRGHLWLFSGDITNAKADLLANRGKGFVYSALLVPENTRRTEALRRWLAALDAEQDVSVVVSHDLADIRKLGLREISR